MAELLAITSQRQIQEEVARIAGYELPIGFDLETTGFDPLTEKLVTIALKPAGRRPLIIDARLMEPDILAALLQPLFGDKRVVLRGHNLQFDVHWMFTFVGLKVNQVRATFVDTMLNELLILGLGLGEAKEAGIHVDLESVATKYGIEVEKESRKWFPRLDKRPEEWFAPLPAAQLRYIRQDVSVVHLIAEKQDALIEKLGLREVADLESRVLPAVAAMRHFGLSVHTAKWNSTMEKIKENIERLSVELHELFDVPILEERQRKFEEAMAPRREWVAKRDAVVEAARAAWEGEDNMEEVGITYKQLLILDGLEDEGIENEVFEVPSMPVKVKRPKKGRPGWGDRKKEVLAKFEEDNPKPKTPSALKDGVNLQSWQQILVGIRSLGYNIQDVKEETLKPLAEDKRIATYLEYVGFSTIKKRYNDDFLKEYAPFGKFFAHWLQIGASTGRFSCYAPNIQQVPDHGLGGELRQAIVPAFGYVFVDADLSNIELRIAAELSGDTVLLNAFAGGTDLHAYTAEIMFGLRNNPDYVEAMERGVKPKAWTDGHDAIIGGRALIGHTFRDIAKTINYMVLFGGGANKLASMLHIPLSDAKVLMRAHRNTYKTVMDWISEQGERLTNAEARATDRAYAVTRSGRRRWFDVPHMNVSRDVTPEQAQKAQQDWSGQMAAIRRQLANHPIQGLAADIAKLVIALWHENFNSDLMSLVAVIHDEFLIQVIDDPDMVARAQLALEACMQQALHTYLTVVNVGDTHASVTDWWKH